MFNLGICTCFLGEKNLCGRFCIENTYITQACSQYTYPNLFKIKKNFLLFCKNLHAAQVGVTHKHMNASTLQSFACSAWFISNSLEIIFKEREENIISICPIKHITSQTIWFSKAKGLLLRKKWFTYYDTIEHIECMNFWAF